MISGRYFGITYKGTMLAVLGNLCWQM